MVSVDSGALEGASGSWKAIRWQSSLLYCMDRFHTGHVLLAFEQDAAIERWSVQAMLLGQKVHQVGWRFASSVYETQCLQYL